MPPCRYFVLVVVALLAPLAVVSLRPLPAEACGLFFSRSVGSSRFPSLAHEQVLVVYDAKLRREHFIRQIVVRQAEERFGFVVPVPSRPEVASVSDEPFTALRRDFGFGVPPKGAVGPGGFGSGLGRLGGGAGVSILDVKKVGSFTAFVLAANDEKGLTKWLAEQKLVKSPDAASWLGHYVRLGFFFVAMRYEPPPPPEGTGDGGKALEEPEPPAKAETMRISFQSPLPYYPYFEPARRGATDEGRLLDLWVASDATFVPVSLLERSGKRHWVRPFRSGDRYEHAQETLTTALGSELSRLLPRGALTVATFQDQKVSRAGFGDVLFVSEQPIELNPERQRELKKFLGVLDPELVPESKEKTP